MIFVATGSQKFQFDRLLKLLDELAGKGKIEEKIFAQVGSSTYRPVHYEYQTFMDQNDFEETIKGCSVLITHCGIGSIISGKKYHIPIIVFPRLKKYEEAVDDHQWEFANAFSAMDYVLMYHEGDDLTDLIRRSRDFKFRDYQSNRENILSTIENYLITFKK